MVSQDVTSTFTRKCGDTSVRFCGLNELKYQVRRKMNPRLP